MSPPDSEKAEFAALYAEFNNGEKMVASNYMGATERITGHERRKLKAILARFKEFDTEFTELTDPDTEAYIMYMRALMYEKIRALITHLALGWREVIGFTKLSEEGREVSNVDSILLDQWIPYFKKAVPYHIQELKSAKSRKPARN